MVESASVRMTMSVEFSASSRNDRSLSSSRRCAARAAVTSRRTATAPGPAPAATGMGYALTSSQARARSSRSIPRIVRSTGRPVRRATIAGSASAGSGTPSSVTARSRAHRPPLPSRRDSGRPRMRHAAGLEVTIRPSAANTTMPSVMAPTTAPYSASRPPIAVPPGPVCRASRRMAATAAPPPDVTREVEIRSGMGDPSRCRPIAAPPGLRSVRSSSRASGGTIIARSWPSTSVAA